MLLQNFHAKNFRNIDELTLDFTNENGSPKSFIVLIGDNGTGKTAILEGITKALGPSIKSIYKDAVKDYELIDSDIKFNTQETSITLGVKLDKENFLLSNAKNMTSTQNSSLKNVAVQDFLFKYKALKNCF